MTKYLAIAFLITGFLVGDAYGEEDEVLAKEAKERMTAGINQYSSPVEKIPQGNKGRAREIADVGIPTTQSCN